MDSAISPVPTPGKKPNPAMKLYLAGVNLCMPLLSQWVGDPEFRELTLPINRDEERRGGS